MRWEHEGEGVRDNGRYLLCLAMGHVPSPDRDDWYCSRCGDVLPQGNKKRQP
jgi:hypothetical protein